MAKIHFDGGKIDIPDTLPVYQQEDPSRSGPVSLHSFSPVGLIHTRDSGLEEKLKGCYVPEKDIKEVNRFELRRIKLAGMQALKIPDKDKTFAIDHEKYVVYDVDGLTVLKKGDGSDFSLSTGDDKYLVTSEALTIYNNGLRNALGLNLKKVSLIEGERIIGFLDEPIAYTLSFENYQTFRSKANVLYFELSEARAVVKRDADITRRVYLLEGILYYSDKHGGKMQSLVVPTKELDAGTLLFDLGYTNQHNLIFDESIYRGVIDPRAPTVAVASPSSTAIDLSTRDLEEVKDPAQVSFPTITLSEKDLEPVTDPKIAAKPVTGPLPGIVPHKPSAPRGRIPTPHMSFHVTPAPIPQSKIPAVPFRAVVPLAPAIPQPKIPAVPVHDAQPQPPRELEEKFFDSKPGHFEDDRDTDRMSPRPVPATPSDPMLSIPALPQVSVHTPSQPPAEHPREEPRSVVITGLDEIVEPKPTDTSQPMLTVPGLSAPVEPTRGAEPQDQVPQKGKLDAPMYRVSTSGSGGSGKKRSKFLNSLLVGALGISLGTLGFYVFGTPSQTDKERDAWENAKSERHKGNYGGAIDYAKTAQKNMRWYEKLLYDIPGVDSDYEDFLDETYKMTECALVKTPVCKEVEVCPPCVQTEEENVEPTQKPTRKSKSKQSKYKSHKRTIESKGRASSGTARESSGETEQGYNITYRPPFRDGDPLTADYRDNIMDELYHAYAAKRGKPEGHVRIFYAVGRDGEVYNAGVLEKESSGNAIHFGEFLADFAAEEHLKVPSARDGIYFSQIYKFGKSKKK